MVRTNIRYFITDYYLLLDSFSVGFLYTLRQKLIFSNLTHNTKTMYKICRIKYKMAKIARIISPPPKWRVWPFKSSDWLKYYTAICWWVIIDINKTMAKEFFKKIPRQDKNTWKSARIKTLVSNISSISYKINFWLICLTLKLNAWCK